MIVAANLKMPGMLRDGVQAVLPAGMLMEPVGRDYTALSPTALARQLELDRRN